MATQEQSTDQATMSLRREGEIVLGNIRDAQTIITVANETWSEKHDQFVGVLDLLDHKLAMIESSTKALLQRVEAGPIKEKRPCSPHC